MCVSENLVCYLFLDLLMYIVEGCPNLLHFSIKRKEPGLNIERSRFPNSSTNFAKLIMSELCILIVFYFGKIKRRFETQDDILEILGKF